MRQDSRYLIWLVVVFAVYFAAGKLGLALATVHPSASAFWPPTGIAIAALLLLGPRAWPAVFVGAFAVNVTTAGSIASSAGIAAGNTLEALAAAYLVRRFANGRHAFLHPGTTGRFAAAAAAACVVSATIGVSTLTLTGFADAAAFGPIWLTWWLGDVSGALVLAPLLVLAFTPVPQLRGRGNAPELIAMISVSAAVAVIVLTPLSPVAAINEPVGYLLFPLLVWPAIRFGPRAAAGMAAGIAALAALGATQGAGPWARGDPNETLLLLQAFNAVAMLTSLVLATLVLERQRAEESLRQVEERLRRAEEGKVAARDEFLQIAAHELRTPITALSAAVQLLLRDTAGGAPSAQTLRRTVELIGAQAARLETLVERLLDTVRIQAGRMELDITEADLVELCTQVAREAQALTTRHEITVLAPQPVRAPVDALRIEQVLRNLVDNAVKFSPGGRVEIAVSLAGRRAEIAVRDRGPGIPPELRERVFERFYQARPEEGRRGLGLGLHVSRHIVQLHGGEITAEQPPGGGTRIVVRLPVAPPLESASPPAVAVGAAGR